MRRDFDLIKNFMQLYNLKLSECKLRSDAYEATEVVWVNETGKRFYKNYLSFNASRYHYTKVRRGIYNRTK